MRKPRSIEPSETSPGPEPGESPRIAFYPFADGAVLHRVGSHRLWVLNPSSAVVWCLLEQSEPGEALMAEYAGHFQLPLEQARRDVDVAVGQFEAAGLFADGDHEWAAGEAATCSPGNCQSISMPGAGQKVPWSRTYRLAGVRWRVRSDRPATVARLFAPLKHLETDFDMVDLDAEVSELPSGWSMSFGGQTVMTEETGILPGVLGVLFSFICSRLQKRLLLHSAVLVRNRSALLLPGETGAGKSTLAAALAAGGWALYSDELAPLDPVTLHVDPFPQPVGIKEPAVEALTPMCPGLEHVEQHLRADGRLVRYLSSPQIRLASEDAASMPVAALVFPRYRERETATRMSRLSAFSALQLLVRTGSSQRPLLPVDVKAFLRLVEGMPCYELVYSDLGEAVQQINTSIGVI